MNIFRTIGGLLTLRSPLNFPEQIAFLGDALPSEPAENVDNCWGRLIGRAEACGFTSPHGARAASYFDEIIPKPDFNLAESFVGIRHADGPHLTTIVIFHGGSVEKAGIALIEGSTLVDTIGLDDYVNNAVTPAGIKRHIGPYKSRFKRGSLGRTLRALRL